MDVANTTSQAEQVKTDTHQTACVKNENSPAYEVQIRSEEENIIAKALEILSRRMRQAEAFFSSPLAVRDFLRLKMAELEFEVFSVIFLDAQHGVIATEEMFRGTLTQTSVYPREVVKRALHHNAAAVIFAHFVARHKMRVMCPDFLCARRKPLRRRLGFVVQYQGT